MSNKGEKQKYYHVFGNGTVEIMVMYHSNSAISWFSLYLARLYKKSTVAIPWYKYQMEILS